MGLISVPSPAGSGGASRVVAIVALCDVVSWSAGAGLVGIQWRWAGVAVANVSGSWCLAGGTGMVSGCSDASWAVVLDPGVPRVWVASDHAKPALSVPPGCVVCAMLPSVCRRLSHLDSGQGLGREGPMDGRARGVAD